MKLTPLRHDAPTPLWLQLKHALRDHITFKLTPGARIPSESELCSFYGLSRMTVRQAITALVNEGLVTRQQGRGSFVMPPRQSVNPRESAHFLDDGFEAGDELSIRVVGVSTDLPPRWIRERLGLAEDAQTHKIRITLAGAEDVLASRTTYIPNHVAPSLLETELTQPLHRILETDFGLEPTSAEETMRLIWADTLRAEMLHISTNDPIILLERIVYLASGEPVEYSRTYYRAEHYRFEHRLVRQAETEGLVPGQNGRRHRVHDPESRPDDDLDLQDEDFVSGTERSVGADMLKSGQDG